MGLMWTKMWGGKRGGGGVVADRHGIGARSHHFHDFHDISFSALIKFSTALVRSSSGLQRIAMHRAGNA
ncbi:hypothetical protein J1614_003208 [Plenodomus biglobosus]|nr:hypothetical protein J1614_003208 [Plenodomus biglobosus]